MTPVGATTTKKLSLHTMTLRTLGQKERAQTAGGAIRPTITCCAGTDRSGGLAGMQGVAQPEQALLGTCRALPA